MLRGTRLRANDADRRERGSCRLVESACDSPGSVSFLREDALDGLDRLLVFHLPRDALQLLVAADLEVLESVRETGELARRIRVSLEERTPVKRAETKRCILQRRRIAAEGV